MSKEDTERAGRDRFRDAKVPPTSADAIYGTYKAVCVSVWVSTPMTASTDSASMCIAAVTPSRGRLRSAPAWVETPDGTSVMSHAYRGQASDQANR